MTINVPTSKSFANVRRMHEEALLQFLNELVPTTIHWF